MTPTGADTLSAEVRVAQRLLWQIRKRDEMLGSHLFGEPAWPILLNLFIAHEEGRSCEFSSLCEQVETSPETGLRWVLTLAGEGMVIRRSSKSDPEILHVTLAPVTVGVLRDLLRVYSDKA